MSQADLIPSGMAPAAPTGFLSELSGAASGKIDKVSRRSMLSAVAAGSAGLMIAGACAGAVHTAPARKIDPDAKFWAKHRQWRVIEEKWRAGADNSDSRMDVWAGRLAAAEADMMLMQVFSTGAVLAKFLAVRHRMEVVQICGRRRFASGDVIAWDLERLAKQEMFA